MGEIKSPHKWENATLTIDSLDLFMQNCSDFIVDRGSKVVIQNHSHIGFCQWHGIEVWGDVDACAADTSWPGGQGTLYLNTSKIDNADVAVFAGTRGLNPLFATYYGGLPTKEMGGGILNITYSTFRHNDLDIMYSERNVGGLCHAYTCTLGTPIGWYGYVWYNTFDTLSTSLCSDDAFTLDTMTGPYGGIGAGCNILDMDLSPWYWSYPWSVGNFQTYCGRQPPLFFTNFYNTAIWGSLGSGSQGSKNVPPYLPGANPVTPPINNIFNYNTWLYSSPCSPSLYH